MGTGAARRAQAQTFTVLHSFSGSDGQFPLADLVRDSAGNLYGTTQSGGASINCLNSDGTTGCGTVFKLSPSGTLTVLHSFTGHDRRQPSLSDGAIPLAGLVRDSDGNLYGTTQYGGGSANCSNDYGTQGCGTVFKLDPSGTLTVLHSFTGSTDDGAIPQGDLVRDSDGNLYGTTSGGGSSGDGTVFKMDDSGALIWLHSFTGYDSSDPSASDGADPAAGLVRDNSGNLYGTTSKGGANYCGISGYIPCGTVFELSPSGALTWLHSLSDSEGATPYGDLVMDASQTTLYGTTSDGGSKVAGTAFKLDTSGGNFGVLHNFAGGTDDGRNPYAGLVRGSDGTLYGTTNLGGRNSECSIYGGCGTVFKLDPSGTLTLLHRFSGNIGQLYKGRLVMDSYGNLYGTTYLGGTSTNCGSVGCGTVFVVSTTPQGATAVIFYQVNGLLAQGVINKGQDNSLVKELQKAIDMMNKGKINGAIANLEDFISEVTDLENSNVLTSDQASALINAATAVIAQIQ
jgi:uncharacterized repeat protein (TIGR03803 family)